MNDLNHYINYFSSLHTMNKLGKPALHKALLLLPEIDFVERDINTNSCIPLSGALIPQFRQIGQKRCKIYVIA